jgi:iron complex outermembrane recepter protein
MHTPTTNPSHAPRHLSLATVALACALLPRTGAAQAAAPSATTTLAPVVVTATRTEAAAFDVPASIDRIDGDLLRDGRMQVNISESLGAVPGLLARDRQNYAQDVQISVRGFGARSTFGVRGVRLYVDGIPATLPDGQGQVSNVDLGSAGRIEVLRGPFSALYGNSAGGVIQVFTEDGSGPPTVGFGVAAGSDGALRLSTKVSGSQGAFGYVGSISRFTSDGYRDHSAVQREIGNLKFTLQTDEVSRLTLVANSVNLPKAQDPLGLTRTQFEADPRSVDPSAISFDTRKTVDQSQVGAVYERKLDGANALRLLAYSGHRNTVQFQSIPVATQAGGVIVLARDYSGADVRWSFKSTLADAPFSLIAGLAYDKLGEQRQGFQNFVGATLGVQGIQRRNERNDVSNFDQYLQASWQFAPAWTLNAGARHSSVRFDSKDAYITGINKDDSGGATYGATLPAVGLMFALSPNLHLYATAGRGFETPTLNELAYRPNGATGLNFGLDAARSNSIEAGVKTRIAGLGEVNAAVFDTRTHNEIATLTNSGGRATFQNVGGTQRKGMEVGWSNRYLDHLRAQVALTWLDAKYSDTFKTCTAAPCTVPNVTVASGNRIPGVARGSAFAALNWAPPQGWRGGIEARYLSAVMVNDTNSDAAASYAVANANIGYVAKLGAWELTGFARVDNLFGRAYIGSVIVNEGNSRFFEPAPGRTWLAGASAQYTF